MSWLTALHSLVAALAVQAPHWYCISLAVDVALVVY